MLPQLFGKILFQQKGCLVIFIITTYVLQKFLYSMQTALTLIAFWASDLSLNCLPMSLLRITNNPIYSFLSQNNLKELVNMRYKRSSFFSRIDIRRCLMLRQNIVSVRLLKLGPAKGICLTLIGQYYICECFNSCQFYTKIYFIQLQTKF